MKKIFSVILVVSLMTFVCSCASADDEIMVTNTEITAKSIPANGTIIAALYDDFGRLTGVKTYKGSDEKKYAGDMAEEIKISKTIKVFVWDLEAITPLGKVYEGELKNLPSSKAAEEPEKDDNTMKLTINGNEFTAELEDNATVAAFREMLPMTLNMSELNSNEKFYYLNGSLPTNSYRPETINAGDIMLYGNNCIVVFYKTFSSSYSYTKIGHITDTSALEDAVGADKVYIEFE